MHASRRQDGSAETAALTQSLAVHAAALESLSLGVCVVDAELRIILFNKRYVEMYDLDPTEVYVGRQLIDILYHSATRGNHPGAQLDEYYRKRLDMMARGEPFRVLRQMPNSRTFSLSFRPLAD